MSKKCDIVRDLMPMRIDGTASETACKYVDDHVADCKPCKTVYTEMKAAVEVEAPKEDPIFADAVKTMQKKRKRRTWRSVLVGVVGALLAVSVMIYAYCWYFVETQFIPTTERMTFSFCQTEDAGQLALMYTSHVPKNAKLRIKVEPDGASRYTAYLSFWATRAQMREDSANIHYILGTVQDGKVFMSDYGEGAVQVQQMIYGTYAQGGRVVFLEDTEMETVSLFGLNVKTPDDILWTDTARNNADAYVTPMKWGESNMVMVYTTTTPMPSPTLQPAGT